MFRTAQWRRNLLTEECGDTCEIRVREADCYDVAWREWFETGHEFAQRDKEYLDRGL